MDNDSNEVATETVDTHSTRDAPSVEVLIERWFADHFHGSPIARDNEIYQHVFHAKEALKRLLKGLYS